MRSQQACDACSDLRNEEWQVALVLLGAHWRGPLEDAALHLAWALS